MNGPIIQASNVCKSYGTGATAIQVLSRVELTILEGECVFLAGPSGSGKTTLLSILGCVLSADTGSVRILGDEVTKFTADDQAWFRRERIGFVFQRLHLIDALTAEENVCVPLRLMRWGKQAAQSRARELLSRVGLSNKYTSRVTQLSMGQRQRVAFARALAADPPLILADEPTASLDAEAGQNAMQLLKDLCAALGKTAIVVTHDPRIYPFADRILHMANGRLAAAVQESDDVDRTIPAFANVA